MAITTLDGIIAGMRLPIAFMKTFTPEGSVPHSTFYNVGLPGAAVAPTPGLDGEALTSYAGQIPFENPASGSAYLARMFVRSSAGISVHLCDRLWQNASISSTTTGAQTVNSVTFPARDMDGSTNGRGVMVAIEVSSATGNGASITNMSMSYTNSAGTSGRTANINQNNGDLRFPATAVMGTFVPFLLEGDDQGVRSIQSLTLGTSLVSGTVHLVAYRVLAQFESLAVSGEDMDAFALGLPKLHNNTVPFLLVRGTGTVLAGLSGQLSITEG